MKHTYNTGIIGNCSFLAHVAIDTNIEWLCWPMFDSSFVFGELLDKENGGTFRITPKEEILETRQEYIENTNVITTTVTTKDGKYQVVDFCPRHKNTDQYSKPLMLMRKIEVLEGTPQIKITLTPKGEYGKVSADPVVTKSGIRFTGLAAAVELATNINGNNIINNSYFALNETKYLALTWGTPIKDHIEEYTETELQKTIQYWKNWVFHMAFSNFQQERIIRSALVLKLHQFEETGAVIAASTTSLPEAPGSGRNWDYRYCWMRDTYYTLNAFNNIGHYEELEMYFHYIQSIIPKDDGRYQPLYSLSGNRSLVEQIIDLPGYLGNQPVRVGNQAYEHIQNDVYGQILVTLLPLYIDNRLSIHENPESLKLVNRLLDKIETTMDEPDAGLWEFRDFAQQHCYTFLFHWAGSSAAIKIAEIRNNKSLLERATQLRDAAAKNIEACYNEELGAYANAIGSKHLDASSLQLILMGYLDENSDRAKNHLLALEKSLMTKEGLFYRYKHADDFGTPETTFLICAFWHVETLAAVGRIEEAISQFKKIAAYENHMGLLSEDVDAKTGSQWGNFPQAYSHVGLLNAASRITKKLDTPNFL